MLAIRNFGHFWSRNLVNWGSQGSGGQGSLDGYYLDNRKPYLVDFWGQIGIYVLFTANREVVYIGQVGSGDQRLGLRLRAHTRNNLRDRWNYFSWFGMRQANINGGKLSEQQKPSSSCNGTNSMALDEVEAVLIQLFEPRLNKQGPKWGQDTVEFFQYVPREWQKEAIQVDNNQLLQGIHKSTTQILSAIEEID